MTAAGERAAARRALAAGSVGAGALGVLRVGQRDAGAHALSRISGCPCLTPSPLSGRAALSTQCYQLLHLRRVHPPHDLTPAGPSRLPARLAHYKPGGQFRTSAARLSLGRWWASNCSSGGTLLGRNASAQETRCRVRKLPLTARAEIPCHRACAFEDAPACRAEGRFNSRPCAFVSRSAAQCPRRRSRYRRHSTACRSQGTRGSAPCVAACARTPPSSPAAVRRMPQDPRAFVVSPGMPRERRQVETLSTTLQ